jgi:hypothetical protein
MKATDALSDELAEIAKIRAETLAIRAQTALLRAETETLRQAMRSSLAARPWYPWVEGAAGMLFGMGWVFAMSWLARS